MRSSKRIGSSLLSVLQLPGRGSQRISPAQNFLARSSFLPASTAQAGIRSSFAFAGQHGGGARSFSSLSPHFGVDKVMTVQQQIYCEVGCNDDERGRCQALTISVTLYDSLRPNLLKEQPDCEDVAAQTARAESPAWKEHANAQLRATHNNENISKIVRHVAEEGRWFTIEALADCIAREVLQDSKAPKATVLIDKPDALRKRGVRTAACEVTRTWESIFGPAQHAEPELTDKVMTLEQQIHVEIGCEETERGRFQEVLVSITVWDRLRHNLLQHQPDFDILSQQMWKARAAEWKEHALLQLKGTHNNALLAKIAQRVAEEGRWFTIEALAESIASHVLAECGAPAVTVRVDKPQALRLWCARAAACEVTRAQSHPTPP